MFAQIVGAALNGLVRRGEREEGERRLTELKDRGFRDILTLLHRLNAQLDLFERFAVDELFECRILSVDEAQRGRGLADLLLASSIDEARRRGFKVALRGKFRHWRLLTRSAFCVLRR